MHTTRTVALSLAIAAASVATGGEHDGVEMEVLGVVPLEADAASLLLLRQKGAQTVLPIFVGRSEGAAIDQRLKRERQPRGGPTADLLDGAIAALGGKVARVDIDGANAAVFSARVTLVQGGRRLDVEARPSESVALALAARAPIFASRKVVAEAGLTREELSRMGHGRRGETTEESARTGAVQSF